MKLSIDVGNGNIKAVTEKGRTIFPTVCVPYIGKIANQKITIPSILKVNRRVWRVGENALLGNVADYEWQQQLNEEKLTVYIATVLERLKVEDNNIQLALGLPIDYYADNAFLLERSITGAVINYGNASVTITDAKIFQQGVGAFMALLKNPSNVSALSKILSYGGGVVDVGEYTTDIVKIGVQGGQFALLDDSSVSLKDVGMHKVFSTLTKSFSDSYGIMIPTRELETAVIHNSGKMILCGQEVDLIPLYTEAVELVAREIKSKISQLWDIRTMGAVIITGGGGPAMLEFLNFKDILVALQNDSIYANAEGYLQSMELEENETDN